MGTVTSIRKGRPKGSRSKTYTCGLCGQQGHSKRNCPTSSLVEPPEEGVAETEKAAAAADPLLRKPADDPDATLKVTVDPNTGEILDTESLGDAEAAALRNAGASGPGEAEAVLARVRARWAAWLGALGRQKAVNEEAKESLEAAKARFTNTVEAGTEAGSGEAELVRKLRNVEAAWQDWQEEIARWKDEKGHAKDEVKAAQGMLREAVENSRQLDLPIAAEG